jgi:3'-phosphoadenosine 5'-phosphosulfate sulfotransferase (PAPS reductase)/FAD synthetase
MTVSLFSPATSVGLLNDEDIQAQVALVDAYYDSVAQVRLLVESDDQVVAHGPVSQGKDSTVVELVLLEAYRQAIEAGTIEASRPLILSTVDTLNEAIPMKMYTRYCKRRVEEYAARHNINLFYDIVTPGLNDEYFVRFVGGQKLIPNATRSGDCSIILKLDPSHRYVRTQLNRFNALEGMQQYANSKVISFVGSRTDEGVRRSGNMQKQGLREKSIDNLMQEVETVDVGKKSKMLKFAPIKHWSTDDVFDFLRLAGQRPVTRMLNGQKAPVPAFLDHFALLLEIYGNGSNDVCEVAVGTTKQGAGCNGKARYGCWNCTMVAHTDQSSTALTGYARWNLLGAEDALRVRDYLFRLSTNMKARAFHARAFDPAGYNRVALQPNILKPRYLEKMVRYASQLSVDSLEHAKMFAQLVAEGREMEHAGYRDIAEDAMMPPKARKAMLEMYKECAQEPIFTSFSERHAVLLSFRWSIDGIGAAPYRPLAIWRDTLAGKGRIPYPLLNTEYEARHGRIKMTDKANPLPEAIMMPIYKHEDPVAFARHPDSLFDLWRRPVDGSDIYEADQNCSTVRMADHNTPVKAKVHFHARVVECDGEVQVHCEDIAYLDVTFAGRKPKPQTLALLMENGLRAEAERRFTELLDKGLQQIGASCTTVDGQRRFLSNWVERAFSTPYMLTLQVPHMKVLSLFGGYQEKPRKAEKPLHFTRRVTKVSKGKISRHNTRLLFYSVNNTSALHQAHVAKVPMLSMDFAHHTMRRIKTEEAGASMSDLFDVMENIDLSDRDFAQWKLMGGIESALAEHDEYLVTLIKKRHLRGYTYRDVRNYGGTHVAESLLNAGPIVISRSYWAMLLKILKRTQIFAELGLFRFQSWRYEELAAYPGVAHMDQHRSDKAEIVQATRALRNQTRRATKQALASLEEGSYGQELLAVLGDNLTQWASEAEQAIHLITDARLSYETKVLFDTNEVPVVQRARVAKLWLTQALEGVGTMDALWKRLLPSKAVTLLKTDESVRCQAVRLTQQLMATLMADARRLTRAWADVSQALAALAEDDKQDRDAVAAVLKQTVPVVYDDMWDFFRPNAANLQVYVSTLQDVIAEGVRDVEQLRTFLEICQIQPQSRDAAEQQLVLI